MKRSAGREDVGRLVEAVEAGVDARVVGEVVAAPAPSGASCAVELGERLQDGRADLERGRDRRRVRPRAPRSRAARSGTAPPSAGGRAAGAAATRCPRRASAGSPRSSPGGRAGRRWRRRRRWCRATTNICACSAATGRPRPRCRRAPGRSGPAASSGAARFAITLSSAGSSVVQARRSPRSASARDRRARCRTRPGCPGSPPAWARRRCSGPRRSRPARISAAESGRIAPAAIALAGGAARRSRGT